MPEARARLDDWEELLELSVPSFGLRAPWLTLAEHLETLVVGS
jgi:hypothetical protein